MEIHHQKQQHLQQQQASQSSQMSGVEDKENGANQMEAQKQM